VNSIRARRRLLGASLLAMVLAVAGLLLPMSQLASAQTATAASAGPKPSIVLVHGAWADSSSWNAVIATLQHDGYTVYVPPNPLLGLTCDSAYLRDFLHTISGPIILVGHSYGGAVITNAATGERQVKALVYVDGFAPAEGQTIGQLLSAEPGSCAVPANLNLVPYPGAPEGTAHGGWQRVRHGFHSLRDAAGRRRPSSPRAPRGRRRRSLRSLARLLLHRGTRRLREARRRRRAPRALPVDAEQREHEHARDRHV